MITFSKTIRPLLISASALFISFPTYAGDDKDERTVVLQRQPTNRPTDDDAPDTIEATIIGQDLRINFEGYAGICNVTVTNPLDGTSTQTTVSSANAVIYSVGSSDTPLVITVETSGNGATYEAVIMPD